MKEIEAVRSREMERLKWRSRRGLLELDIVLERFWAGCGEELDDADAAAPRESFSRCRTTICSTW